MTVKDIIDTAASGDEVVGISVLLGRNYLLHCSVSEEDEHGASETAYKYNIFPEIPSICTPDDVLSLPVKAWYIKEHVNLVLLVDDPEVSKTVTERKKTHNSIVTLMKLAIRERGTVTSALSRLSEFFTKSDIDLVNGKLSFTIDGICAFVSTEKNNLILHDEFKVCVHDTENCHMPTEKWSDYGITQADYGMTQHFFGDL
jgi:hypothetical protein